MKTYIFALLYFVFIGSYTFAQTKSRGVPASPYPFQTTQPDGSQITLIPKGDGVVHWFETEDGYSVLKAKNGWFQHASLSNEGDMVCSGVSVSAMKSGSSSLKTTQIGFNKHLRYSSKQIKRKKLNYFGEESRNKSARRNAFPTSGTRKVLMILAEFDDLAHQISKDDFNNLMNKENYNGTGSFRDYYIEASYNQLDVTTITTVWVKVPKTLDYYGKNDEEDNDSNPQEFIRHAVDAAEAAGVDFSQYDNDGDGYVDAVQVIHAGFGEEAGANDNTIWSHAWALNDKAVKYDGVTINRYVTFPELRGTTGTGITHIGVICHEFGHGLGLPDYYDTSDDGDYAGDAAGLGKWDIMASGSWNNGGATPAHHNAYSKYLLGWLDLKEFTQEGEFSVNNLAQNSEAYRFYSKTENEFFVVENRQKIGFDSYIPHHGMLVYHVDRNHQGWNDNNVNSDPDHEAMDLLEADNNADFNVFADPFPGTGNKIIFSDLTTPGSISWAGVKSEIEISNIAEANNIISFNFSNKKAIMYTVKFLIKDAGNPVEGVEVQFGDQTKRSDEAGEIYFYDIAEGEYSYTIKKYGFYSENNGINVQGENELIEVPVNFLALAVKSVEKEIKIYPNPTTGLVYIDGSFTPSAVVKVVNLKGEVLVQKKMSDSVERIDLGNLLSGIYNVLIVDGEKKIIKRIIVR